MRIGLYLLASFICLDLCACSLTPNAQLDGRSWLLETTGKVAGADIQRDLGYHGTSPQLDLEGSAGLGRNSVTADWVHVDRSANGTANNGFSFNGITIPTSSAVSSHTDGDLVTAFYGYKIGSDAISITPGLGAGYAHYDVHARGTLAFASRATQGLFSTESRNSQVFPIGAIQLESLPIGWLDLVARADGFGIPQGQIVEGLGLVRAQFKHLRVESGYRLSISEAERGRFAHLS